MGWILLEALVALLLAIGIVWWTTGSSGSDGRPMAPAAATTAMTAARAERRSMQYARNRTA